MKASFLKIERHLIKKPGAFFIIVFDVLLLACAFLLIQGNPLVNDVGVVAYCFLIVGIVLQAISFLKDKRLKDVTAVEENV